MVQEMRALLPTSTGRIALVSLAGASLLAGIAAEGALTADGQGAAAKVKMKTSARIAPAKGKKVRYVGRVRPGKIRVRGKHLPSGISRNAAKRAARKACIRDWRALGSITVRSGAKFLGSDTNLTRRLKWSVKARRKGDAKASGPQLFAQARAGGKSFAAQCTAPRKRI